MSIDNNFTIRDNVSQFAKYLPSKYIEPLTIIARIKGYDGIDDYILDMIRSRLQMFLDTSDTVEYEEFQQYMHNMIIGKDVPNEWTAADTSTYEEKETTSTAVKKEDVSDFVRKVHDKSIQKFDQQEQGIK
jgi:hypothetical protein